MGLVEVALFERGGGAGPSFRGILACPPSGGLSALRFTACSCGVPFAAPAGRGTVAPLVAPVGRDADAPLVVAGRGTEAPFVGPAGRGAAFGTGVVVTGLATAGFVVDVLPPSMEDRMLLSNCVSRISI